MAESPKTAFITGGSRGIGLGVAHALVQIGYRVTITGRDQQRLADAEHALNAVSPGCALALICDVRHPEAQAQAVAETLRKFGSIDVLVANAGLGHFAPIDQLTIAQWQETIETNLSGVFYSVHAALDALKASRGYIFTISSLAGTNFFAAGSAYNASKFGLTGFTQAIMMDLRKYGIRVATLMPGSVATEFSGKPAGDEGWKIQPEDIGQLIADLLRINPRSLPSKIEIRPSMPK